MVPHWMRPEKFSDLRIPTAIAIGGVWALAFLVGIYTESWIALTITTPLVTIIVMALFKNGKSERNGEPKE